MTRLGWGILVAVLLSAGVFLSLLRFGGVPTDADDALVRREVPQGEASGGPGGPAGRLVVPVAGHPRGAIADSWGDARGGGERAHTGADIAAARGTPVVAAAAGVVERLFVSAAGGNTIYVRSPDRCWTYYYAHLDGYAAGLAEGQAVRAGQRIGYVGDSGNAGAGNTHLHFGISRMRPDDGWSEGEPVNPQPLLARGDLPR